MKTSVSSRGEKLQIAPEVIQRIRELIATNGSIRATARAVGVTPPTVRKYARAVLEEMKVRGLIHHPTPPISKGSVARIAEALKTGESLNGIARDLGMSHTTVKRHAKRFIEQMKQSGTLGHCICGQARFHPRICAARFHGAVDAAEADRLMRRRSLIVDAIKEGLPFTEIGRRFGINPNNAKKYCRHMSPAEIQNRRTVQASKRSKKKRVDRTERFVFRPHNDPAYARFAALMPRWLSDPSRDDALSELYVAHLEGGLPEGDIAAEVKRYASRTARDFESQFGLRSLDERPFDDGRETWADRLADPETIEPLEHRLSI